IRRSERDQASRGDPLERGRGRPRAPAALVPAAALDPAGFPDACRGAEHEAERRIACRGPPEIVLGCRERGAREVEVRVGDPRNRDLAGLELDPTRVGICPRLEVDRRAGERNLPVADPDRLHPAEAGVTRARGDPAADELVERHGQPGGATGGRGARSMAGPQPGGSASSVARAARSKPVPSPSASAIRAFGPERWPASSAPARSHVAPPPGNAYASPAAPAGQRVANTTTIPCSMARPAASTSAEEVFPAPVAS